MRRFAGFVLRTIPVLLTLLLLYPALLPRYQGVVVATANTVLLGLRPPLRIAIDEEGSWTVLVRLSHRGDVSLFGMSPRTRQLQYVSLILVPALLLATPVSLRRRLILMMWGLLMLFVLHTLVEVGLARSYVCLDLDPDNFVCGWVIASAQSGAPLLALVPWALLTWDSWFPGHSIKMETDPRGAVSRNMRCPCGSGRKHKRCCGQLFKG